MKLSFAVVCLCFFIGAQSMDIGTGGVYDSPFATDYFVRQYGFMFGGGRSGLMGLKAMQSRTNKMYKFPSYAYTRPTYQPLTFAHKNMELAPLVMKTESSKPVSFNRFMAVP